MIDLLVIGAGLSGLMAAYTAAKAGLSVRVIAKGLGSMHWTAGTVDVLGYGPDGDVFAVERPLDAIAGLAQQQPGHPYGQLGSEAVEAALSSFSLLAEELGLPYAGSTTPGANVLLPSPAGAVRPVWLAPLAQLGGDLGRPEPLLIVGFNGMRDFYPQLIAENLRKQGHAARAASLPLDLITDRRDSNTVHLAQALDNRWARVRLAEAIKKITRPGERVGLPAILGLDSHSAALDDMEPLIGGPVFEIPTLPPSVPGIRLFRALRGKLNEMGVQVVAGIEATGYGKIQNSEFGMQNSLAYVESATSSRPMKQRAKHFLLATGGILGGGFNSDHTGRVWEVMFDLPLTVPQQRSQWFRPTFLDPAGQPIFRGGVAVNADWQPVDTAGQVIFNNLRAAGGALAHADPILERSLEGLAISTGVAAAQKIIAQELGTTDDHG